MAQYPAATRQGPTANGLPWTAYRGWTYTDGPQRRFNLAPSSWPVMPQMPHMVDFAARTDMPIAIQQYYMGQEPSTQQFYTEQMLTTQQEAWQNMGWYPDQRPATHQQPGPSPLANYYHANQYPGIQPMPNPTLQAQDINASKAPGESNRASQSSHGDHWKTYSPASQITGESVDGRSGVVRGPPRKPRLSGFAIWIGNIPPRTDLMSLVHHVCNKANGLESLFLISKSSCAFANFRDEPTCVAAQHKIHDSIFQSVRLASRLRGNDARGNSGVTAPTAPAVMSGSQTSYLSTQTSAPESRRGITARSQSAEANYVTERDGSPQQDRFFILKSLTVEDIELSVKTGTWATQSHNEKPLNDAFKAADNVYLVFSANKSGEYFGYARMSSPINEDPTAVIGLAPKAQPAESIGPHPIAIPTDATEFCPRGIIIDDSARGTIFWEAERENTEGMVDVESDPSSRIGSGQDGDGLTIACGKLFKLEWLSTTKLPFWRTRGLRNPWNSNREVKIARDGTELEPSVGRKLISLFN